MKNILKIFLLWMKRFFKSNQKKRKEDLYIKIILWAYNKQESGFTWEQIRINFNLNNLEENWVRKIFFTTSDQDRKFFEHLRNEEKINPNQHFYSLNEKGINTAINYKSLVNAEKNSIIALWFVGLSLFATALMLFLQFRQTKLVEIQSIPEQINQARAINSAKEFCKQNPDAKESGLFMIANGIPASCNYILHLKN